MSANIDRIMAQRDMRALQIANVAMDGEISRKYRERLELEVGTVIKVKPEVAAVMRAERDEGGFAQLREMAKEKIGTVR